MTAKPKPNYYGYKAAKNLLTCTVLIFKADGRLTGNMKMCIPKSVSRHDRIYEINKFLASFKLALPKEAR